MAFTAYYFIAQSYNASSAFSAPTSELAYLTPSPAVTIRTQPQSQTVASGQTTSLSVVATGSAPISYQWFVVTVGPAHHRSAHGAHGGVQQSESAAANLYYLEPGGRHADPGDRHRRNTKRRDRD